MKKSKPVPALRNKRKRPARRAAAPPPPARSSTVRSSTAQPHRRAKLRLISEEILQNLQEKLRESQETLEAIRSGEVDAVVVNGSKGNQIYTLTGAEQPFRVYVERMQEGAVTVSPEGIILYANQRFADMIKLPLERVIGSFISNNISAAAWSKISTVFNRPDIVVKHEYALRREGGRERAVSLTASQLPLADQTVMCLVVTDLTEHKDKEKLKLAKEVAEKANESKDNFLAALSHELRTPLTPVLMTAAALEHDESVPPALRESLTIIRRNVELEARLIDDLLDLTRVTHGKFELHREPVDIHTVLHQAIEICEKHLREKRQNLTLELDASHCQINADSVRIQQVLWNLVRNSVKFTPPGGNIHVKTTNPTPDSISLTVIDDGIGFDPKLANKLFQAFEQGSKAITRQYGGLGLGLVICRSIVEAHSGRITAESAGHNCGATFTLVLPASQAAAQDSVNAHPVPAASPEPSPKRILLVEDHADSRKSLEYLLRKNRHEVISTNSGTEALQLAGQYEFDLVISDLGLPDISGLEMMEKLNRKFGLRGIGVSGYGMEEDIKKSHAAGFVHHLIKPIKFDQLKVLINDI